MTNIKFLKTLTAGVALTLATCPQAWAASGTCGDNCTWEIADGELKIQGTGNMDNYGHGGAPWHGQRGSITKITIDEGITSIGEAAFYSIPATSISLPSTLKSIKEDAFRDSGIHSLVLPDGFESLGRAALANITQPLELPASIKYVDGRNGYPNPLIINAKNNFVFGTDAFRGFNNVRLASLNIQCKGDMDICENMLVNVRADMENNGKEFNLSYYTGLNKDGNWEVWSDDGVALYADSTLQKLLGKYDFEGNQTASYKYDGAGNLTAAYENGVSTYKKTSYTPAEAAAAIKKGNNNKVTLTFK